MPSLVLYLPNGLDCILLHQNNGLKRFKKILKWFFIVLLALLAGVYIFIQTPFGQNWITRQVTKKLSRDLQTKVSIQHVDFSLMNKMHLEGVLVEDRLGDTLLYAGDVKVRITDWFIFKKNVQLKYIGLENAVIKLQRPDSVWRHQFLVDYFSSPPDSSKKKKGGISLDLKKAELKNVTLIKKDAWLGDDMSVNFGSLNLDAEKMDFKGNKYLIRSVTINSPVISLAKYDKRKPSDTVSANEIISDVFKPVSWNKGGAVVQIAELSVKNGIFKNDKLNGHQQFAHFDGQHILFSDINTDLKNISFISDTILTQIELNAKERSGLIVKEMKADVKVTPQGMAFSNMNIETNRSNLRNYFAMSYDDMGKLGDFIHKVRLTAVFKDSYVHSDDIAFFAPALKTWNKKINLSGKLRGQVDDFVGRELRMQAGGSTILDGDITMTGLPDINQTFIDFNAKDFRTTYNDAAAYIPAIRKVSNPDLSSIQYLNFKGNFTGFIRDFVTYGTIQTNLGNITSDLNMKLPKGKDPVYAGSIETDNFRLGTLIGDKNTGSLAVKAAVKGKGFSAKTRNTLIDGTIKFIEYNNYRYENIALKGTLDKNLFEGYAKMNDENAKLELNGIIDFNDKMPKFNVLANVFETDLRKLRFTSDSIQFRGKTNVDFSGQTLDDFLGTARIADAEILKNGQRLPFDSLIITAGYSGNEKKLSVSSNEFMAEISGDYNLKELPDAFAWFLNKYYPSAIKAPKRIPQNQRFSFEINTYYIDEYIRLINDHISGFNFSKLKGSLNTSTQEMAFNGTIPQFKFKQYNFDEVRLEANGNKDRIELTGEMRNILLNDSLSIPLAKFGVNSHNDSSRVSLQSGASQAVESANINALVKTFGDGTEIEFDKSDFTLNGKQWTIADKGKLILRRNTPLEGNVVMTESDQKIILKTEKSENGSWNNIRADLTKINLGDIGPFIMPKNRLEGLVTGNVLIENPTGNMNISSNNIRTEQLRLDNDSLGEVNIVAAFNNPKKELTFNGSTVNQENNLTFNGSVYLDPAKAADSKIALKAKRFEIKVLERFLGTLFSDMQGYLTGDIDLDGAFKSLAVTGKGKLENAGLKIIFTQCFYKIKDTYIELTPEEINLDGLTLVDTVTKNPVYIKGGIEHSSFKNMLYNLEVSTKRPGTTDTMYNRPVLLLNTSLKDNKQFYGRVKGTGSLSVSGTDKDMYITIDAKASEKDSSYVTLPPSTSRESGMADFLVEKKYGREMNESDFRKKSTNLTYDVRLTANPAVTVRMILDELTGDEIKGKGQGTLNIRSGTTEPLTLRGRFDIDEGNYLFTFQSFFKKPFVLDRREKNYITWDGDPYGATMNVTAVYTASNVNLTPLATLLNNDDNNLQGQREDVYVVANLSDSLFKPNYKFSLKFPENSRVNTNPSLALGVQQLEKNENELNKQVAYLIVLNSFAPAITQSTAGNTMGNTLNEFAYSTFTSISGLLFNEINKVVNNTFAKIFGTDKIGFNISGSVYNRNLLEQRGSNLIPNQSQLDINIPIYISDRFYVKLGSRLDLALQNSSTVQENLRFLPDVTLEWLVNETGTLRASLFYQQNIDALNPTAIGQPGKATRYGGSFSLRKDFNKIGDLFKKRNSKKQKPEPTQTAPPGEAKKEEPVTGN